jgi:hypothetical protein
MDQLIVVSMDSHAQAPPEAWPEYLEARYHEYLPQLHEDNVLYNTVMTTLAEQRVQTPENVAVYDTEHAYRDGGYLGVWDRDLRLREMDREGIAAEFLYQGDHRATSLFNNVFSRKYDLDVCEAGVRAYHRWLADTMGGSERLLLVGAGGAGADIDATVAELHWLADHGYAGTFLPGFLAAPGVPPFFDPYWEPVWQVCEERGLPIFVHAGFGLEHGLMFGALKQIKDAMDASDAPGVTALRVAAQVFPPDFFADVRPRRPLWQLTLGGVFDRHPGLRMVMTEVRSDWLPATLRALDELYLRNREAFPAQHSPTEYWHTHCMTSFSFVHRSEVAMRHEIGIETVGFGRDYPHNEATWPNTLAWLRDAFDGVPENEVRLILGENVIRFLDLDRAPLAAVAQRIGPTMARLGSDAPPVDPALLTHFDLRGGYLKPAEGDAKLAEVMELVTGDLAAAGLPS